jgi:hypothetical protein
MARLPRDEPDAVPPHSALLLGVYRPRIRMPIAHLNVLEHFVNYFVNNLEFSKAGRPAGAPGPDGSEDARDFQHRPRNALDCLTREAIGGRLGREKSIGPSSAPLQHSTYARLYPGQPAQLGLVLDELGLRHR